jgi:GTP cyclohydrolase I
MNSTAAGRARAGSCGTFFAMPDDDRRSRIAYHVGEILALAGVDASTDPEVDGTPDRVADLVLELTAGLGPAAGASVLPDDAAGSGLVIARDLPFHSICVHHLLPFFGRAHIGYLPGTGVVGIGTLGRVLDHFARRPQLQERLGEQVAEYLEREVGARGAIVVLEARQLCMEMRGGRKPGLVESTAARGELADGPLRREFFDRVLGPGGGGEAVA